LTILDPATGEGHEVRAADTPANWRRAASRAREVRP
jgi:hypothetical protein